MLLNNAVSNKVKRVLEERNVFGLDLTCSALEALSHTTALGLWAGADVTRMMQG